MLDDLRLWIPIIAAFLLLLFFMLGYLEAIISSWRPGSLSQSFAIRDEIATTLASIIGTIVAGAFGFNMAISTPDARSLDIKGAQGAGVARGAESLATGTTVRATAATQAAAKVVTPQGTTTPVAIKETIIAIFASVYMLTGLACLITWMKKGNNIINKVKTLAIMTFSLMVAFLMAMFA